MGMVCDMQPGDQIRTPRVLPTTPELGEMGTGKTWRLASQPE